jgi:peptidoglycan/LPS O-acetylase OafA/YrhL
MKGHYMAGIARLLIRKWKWIYGVSLAALFLGAVIFTLTDPSPEDTTIYYMQSGPLTYLWFLLICGIPGMLLAVIFYLIRSRKGAQFMLLLIGTLFLIVVALAMIGPAVGGHFEREHMDSARLDGHVYNLARGTSFSYYPSTWILFECDALGIRCSEVHHEAHSYSTYSSGQIVTESDSLTIIIGGETVYSFEPDD